MQAVTVKQRKIMSDPGDSVENLPAVSGERAPRSQGRALEILAVLQTTLEADKLIELFSVELAKTLAHDSIAYENPVQDLEVNRGTPARHSCSYRLVVAQEPLGRLTLTRARRFSPEDLAEVENLLVSLVYPLRNALAHQRALESALKDPLTGLYNRTALNAALHRELKLAQRNQAPLSLVVLDIDHFKRINDRCGHAAGDTALKVLAGFVANCIRSTDVLARFGGEEFAVLLNSTDRKGALLLAERIRAAAHGASFHHNDHKISFTVSLGVATLREQDDERSLFERADQALYLAKHRGRDRVEYAD
jgi:diguanylate cyclase (GGDEF)-like protein